MATAGRLDDLLTTSGVCALLGKSPGTVMNWRKYKGLPVVEIHGDIRSTIRFSRKAVLQWARKQNIKVAAAQGA